MSEESTLSFRGLCRYIHRLSKASKAGMKAALADCPKCHFPMLEGLLGCIRLHGQDGAVYISDLVQELHQPLPAISRTVRQMEQDGTISTRGLKQDAVHYGELVFDVNSAYFHNHGGYEYAKQFYEEAYGNRCKRFDLLLGGRL